MTTRVEVRIVNDQGDNSFTIDRPGEIEAVTVAIGHLMGRYGPQLTAAFDQVRRALTLFERLTETSTISKPG